MKKNVAIIIFACVIVIFGYNEFGNKVFIFVGLMFIPPLGIDREQALSLGCPGVKPKTPLLQILRYFCLCKKTLAKMREFKILNNKERRLSELRLAVFSLLLFSLSFCFLY